jgi:predicted alpha/beta-fold hydrolase
VVDVWRHFKVDPAHVDSLWHNWEGIEQTAQVISPAPEMDAGHIRRAAWVGFTDVELPGTKGALLFARLGIPDEAHRIPGSAVIITHGLFGSLDGTDMLNHVQALRRAGHVVLALEMRGHGETHCRYPEYSITFGMYEAGDLVEAAQWLKRTVSATRVGLVSFSLTGYEALLTAWLDGHRPVTEFDEIPAFAALPKPGPQPAFNGGMLVVSAPVGILGLADRFEPRLSPLEAPCKGTFQNLVAARLASYKDPPGYGMWDLARNELTRAGFVKDIEKLDEFRSQFSRFIDLSGESWALGAARMENVRVPLLVLHAANDPLATAQGVADLFGRVRNPNVGVVLLKQGGHMGFSALSADYYYSVMINFFDPATAPLPASADGRLVQSFRR